MVPSSIFYTIFLIFVALVNYQNDHFVNSTDNVVEETMKTIIEEDDPDETCVTDPVMRGKKCTHSIENAEHQCSSRHGKYIDGQCHVYEYVDAVLTCPENYTFSELTNECILEIDVEAKMSCPSRYTLTLVKQDGKEIHKCIKEGIFKPILSCPLDYKLTHDGKCYKQIIGDPIITCPDGSAPSKKGCVSIEHTGPIISCPKDYILQDHYCIKKGEKEKVCPQGFTFFVSHDGEEYCTKKIIKHSKIVCLEGEYDKETNYCKKIKMKDPEVYCKNKDAKYIDGKCIIVVEQKPVVKCDDGYQFDPIHEKCINYEKEDPEFKCKIGETLNEHKKCVKIEKTDFILVPNDKITDPETKCPHGYKLVLDICESVIKTDPIIFCGKNTELKHGKCVGVEEIDPEIYCKTGDLTGDNLCKEITSVDTFLKCPKSHHKHSSEPHKCVKREVVSPMLVCPPNSIMKHGKCIAGKILSGNVRCDEGFIFDGSVCIRIIETNPKFVYDQVNNPARHTHHISRQIQRLQGATTEPNTEFVATETITST